MKIIFIHGMNQQNYNADNLKQHWLDIFQQGINELKLAISVSDLDISLPFYGDLITKHQLSNRFDLDTFLPKSWVNLHFHKHSASTAPTAPNTMQSIPVLPYFMPEHELKLSKRLYLVSQLFKDKALKEFSVILNNFPKLHESLIHKFLIETYLYLANPQFMDEVHQRILASLEADQAHLIVAHSLGTVIAYNLLQQLSPRYKIQRFITLGSPLAFKVIQSRLTPPIQSPACLNGDWHNFYSPDDFLTAFPLVNAPFDFQPAILNTSISTFIHSPHQIAGYLQHPAVIKNIVDAL
ncbi:esterase/lipase family protein [Acinetobacter nematophilus]|uniref:esterase/lipase family protein n=1 Tax=Acinetobacter nematophilus TaxID=2994642 RepID=UPI003AF99D6E